MRTLLVAVVMVLLGSSVYAGSYNPDMEFGRNQQEREYKALQRQQEDMQRQQERYESDRRNRERNRYADEIMRDQQRRFDNDRSRRQLEDLRRGY